MPIISLNLGVDFGTSFTKVCVRDTDNNRSWIIAFGKSKSCEESVLSSLIGVMPDGRLVGGLTTKEWEQHEKPLIAIDFIKIRLAGLPPLDTDYANWQNRFELLPKFKNIDLNKSGRIRGLAAFYLSRVIWRAKSWIMENNADLVEGNDIIWTAQICVPVKYCDSPLISRFSEVFHLAWLLSEREELGSASIPPSGTIESLQLVR